MEAKKALAAFGRQRAAAFARGIEWHLTFKQWVEWWGEDIDRRGVGHDKFQMQRPGDVGPYALWNIRKGYPRDNARTRARMELSRRTRRAQTARFQEAMGAPYRTEKDPRGLSADDWELHKMFSPRATLLRTFGHY